MLTIINPAPDRGLLSIEELRAAVGLADGDTARDAEITALGLKVSAEIASFCCVTRAGASPPTLRQETVEEVQRLNCTASAVILSRRFATVVVSASHSGADLDINLLELDGAAGLLGRLDSSDRQVNWQPGKLVVRYMAGFAVVPDDLKACATDLVRHMDSSEGRDPLLRAQQWDGIGREEYQIASGMQMAGGIPADIAARLAPYVTTVI